MQRVEHDFVSQGRGPLDGIVVLDLGQAAVAPIAACYLGMLGATVIKVEPPRGDIVRVGEPNMRGTSTTFIGNNWNKLGVSLDLNSEEGRAHLAGLIRSADLLIENFRSPMVLERLGFGYETVISELNSRLVYVESSAFGGSGPLSDMISNEWITEAIGGMVAVTGSEGRPEFMRGTSLLDWSGAMVNTVACLAALLQRDLTGTGLAVRTSQLGSTIFAGLTRFVECLASGESAFPAGSDGQSFAPDGAFATEDGFLSLSAVSPATWEELCSALGLEGLAGRAEFADNAERVGHRDQLRVEIERRLREKPTSEWLGRLSGRDVPHAVFPAERWLSDELAGNPQVVANQSLYALPTPWGLVKTQAPHWKFSETPAAIYRPSPVFGQDNVEIFAGLEAPGADPAGPLPAATLHAGATFVTDDPGGLRPLDGLRVLEVAAGLCGPLAARVLQELGARVDKVVGPRGDWMETAAPGGRSDGALYRELNAGKKVSTLDLEAPTGQEELLGRLAETDVIIAGYNARQVKALAISYEDIAALRPEVLYCQVTGWGSTGPDADRPATEFDVQAAVGMYRHLGRKGDPPVRVGYDLASVNTALAAVQGVLAALVERARSGRGQKIEVSMLATAIAISQWGITAESGPDRVRGLQLEGYDLPPDFGVRCGDGRSCRLDFRKDYRNWYRLFDRLGVSELTEDPRFSTEGAIGLNRNELAVLLTEELGDWSFAQLDDFVRSVGGTVVPVLGLEEVLAHPQMSGLDVVRPGVDTTVRFPYLTSYWRSPEGTDRGPASPPVQEESRSR